MTRRAGRNDPCPCGSGKKYKNCHFDKDEAVIVGEMGTPAMGYRKSLRNPHSKFAYTDLKQDKVFQRALVVVQKSLERYRETEVASSQNTVRWKCRSRLFQFQVALQEVKSKCEVLVSIPSPASMEFELDRQEQSFFDEATGIFSGPKHSEPGSENPFRIDAADKTVLAFFEKTETVSFLKSMGFFETVTNESGLLLGRGDMTLKDDVDQWPAALGSLILFAHYLRHYAETGELVVGGEALCPYCRDKISKPEPVVACRICHTVHHRECWQETGHCSVFGCSGKRPLSQ